MKKLLLLSIILFCGNSLLNIDVNAATHKHDSKGMEQVMDHYILDQFQDEIKQAITTFYEKDSITYQYNWGDNNYDVVEIKQSEKGNQLNHPYVITLTVISYDDNNRIPLGTDTLTFGVAPISFNQDKQEKNIASMKAELINYKHVEP